MKTSAQRIHYYVRKVAQYSAKRRVDRGRYNRLMTYKTAMNKRIEAERSGR